MTRLITIFILTTILFSCSSGQKTKIIEKWVNGKSKIVVSYDNPNDTLTYLREFYFENGMLGTRGKYVNGKKDGLWQWWYDNGHKKDVATISNDLYVGERKHWREDGTLRQVEIITGKCFGDCCDGIITLFYPNGKIQEKWNIKSGLLNGVYEIFYINGQKKSQRIFKDDKENGISMDWDEMGRLTIETTFRLGIEDGPRVEYFKRYNIHGQYINGKEEGEWKYIDSLGKVLRIDIYRDGKLYKEGEKIKI